MVAARFAKAEVHLHARIGLVEIITMVHRDVINATILGDMGRYSERNN